jgi:hypothetical protein
MAITNGSESGTDRKPGGARAAMIGPAADSAGGYHRGAQCPGIIWTSMTAAVMFALAAGKARIGRALGNAVLGTEGRSR